MADINGGGSGPAGPSAGPSQSQAPGAVPESVAELPVSDATASNAATPVAGNLLNERTYQEVEYLKRNLGPILVAALAEICIRRPADPIEYLGHWLLRWRYNEELKRRDVQNALEVVRRKTWDGAKEEGQLPPNPFAPEAAPAPETYGEGFVPQHPYSAPGYGGPIPPDQLKKNSTAATPSESAAPASPSKKSVPSPTKSAEPEVEVEAEDAVPPPPEEPQSVEAAQSELEVGVSADVPPTVQSSEVKIASPSKRSSAAPSAKGASPSASKQRGSSSIKKSVSAVERKPSQKSAN